MLTKREKAEIMAVGRGVELAARKIEQGQTVITGTERGPVSVEQYLRSLATRLSEIVTHPQG